MVSKLCLEVRHIDNHDTLKATVNAGETKVTWY